MAEVKELTVGDRSRIQREVILQRPGTEEDSPEEKKFRAAITKEWEAARKEGIMLDFEQDWED